MNVLVISRASADYDDIIKAVDPTNVQRWGTWYTQARIDNEILFFLKLKYKVLPHITYEGIVDSNTKAYIIE